MSDISALHAPMCLPTDDPACMPDDLPADEPAPAPAAVRADEAESPGLAFLMPPPVGVQALAGKAVETALQAGPALTAGSAPWLIGLGVVAGVVFGFPGRAGDGLPAAEADGAAPPKPSSDGEGPDASGQVTTDEAAGAEPEPAPAAAAPPARDGGVPPPASRSTEFVTPASDPGLDALVAQIKASRSADPATQRALREALRQQEVAGLHQRIDALREQIVQSTHPEQHVLIDELVRSYNRLIELGAPYHDPVE